MSGVVSVTCLEIDSFGSTIVTVAVSVAPLRSKVPPALVGTCPGVRNQAVVAELVRAVPAVLDGTSSTVAV